MTIRYWRSSAGAPTASIRSTENMHELNWPLLWDLMFPMAIRPHRSPLFVAWACAAYLQYRRSWKEPRVPVRRGELGPGIPLTPTPRRPSPAGQVAQTPWPDLSIDNLLSLTEAFGLRPDEPHLKISQLMSQLFACAGNFQRCGGREMHFTSFAYCSQLLGKSLPHTSCTTILSSTLGA